MLRKIVLLTLLLMVVITPAAAQTDDWQVWFYDGTALQVLTADGLAEPIALPDGVGQVEPYHGLGFMALSPDSSRLVFSRASSGVAGSNPVSTLEIADLANDTCCIVVAHPLTGDPDTVIVGPFSPDGTQVVVIFAQVYSLTPQSIVAVVDVASGDIVQQADTMATFGDMGLLFDGWDADGVKVATTCLACGGRLDGWMSNWDPVTGAITPDVQYFNLMGDKLEATGEYVIPVRNEDLPASNENGMFPPSNAVEYLPDASQQTSALIYHDPVHIEIGNVNWVMDGQAYLITEWYGTAVVVQRDGTALSVETDEAQSFISSTPDGWLMQNYNTQVVSYYQVRNGQIGVTTWDNFPTRVVVLNEFVSADAEFPMPVPVVK